MANLNAISAAVQNIKNKIPGLTQQVSQLPPAPNPQAPMASTPPATPTTAPQAPQTQQTAQIPTANPSAFSTALQGLAGVTPSTDTSGGDMQAQLAALYTKAYTPSDAETTAQGQFNQANSQVVKTQQMLDDLDKDLATRMSGAGPISSSFINREKAVESVPLTRELNTETSAANLAQNTLAQAQANRTSLQGAIPGLTSLAEYQTPQQQLAAYKAQQDILEQEKLQEPVQIARGGTAYTPATGQTVQGQPYQTSPKTVSTSQGIMQWNPDTQKWESTGFKPPVTVNQMSPSQGAVDAQVQYYQTTGTIPPMGLGQASRNAFWNAVAQGGDTTQTIAGAAANKAALGAATTALKTQQNQYSANSTALGTLDKQFDIVSNLSNQVDRSGKPVLNKYLLWTKGQYAGDADTVALQNAIQTASYEFAKILSGSAASISGTTISSADDAKNVLNANMTPTQITKVINLMKQESQNRLDSQKQTISDIQNDIKNLGNTSTQSTGQAGAGSVITYQGKQYSVDANGDMTPVSQ